MKDYLNNKVIPAMMAFINTKAIQGLKDGLLYSMPMMIIGSVFLLLANFPYVPLAEALATAGITPVLNQVFESTFNLMALIASVGIAYTYVRNEGYNGMPAGVPEGVATSFVALIPGTAVIVVAAVIYAIVKAVADTTPIEWIYKVIQLPLQGLTDTFGGVIGMGILIPFLWFFGVHGSTIVGGIMGPILSANSAANQAILDQGLELNLANGGHIVTQQFLDQFMTVTGAGLTIGLVVYLAFFSKSTQCRQIGKLGVGPAFFNINEPVLFGTPVVLNPIMAVPFMLMPVISGVIQYLAIYTGLCPMYSGILVPWTCPPIISGFLIGGVRTMLLQIFILILSFFVYFPFIRVIDKMYFKQESEAK